MDYKKIIPLIDSLIELGLLFVDIVDQSEDVDAVDKESLKARIRNAQDKVKYWEDGEVVSDTPEGVVVADNNTPAPEYTPVCDNN